MECTEKLLAVRKSRLSAEESKILNVIDMALGFSAMMRLFETGCKQRIRTQISELLPRVYACKSESEFRVVHNSFCEWGVEKITRTVRRKHGEIVKPGGHPSYGQMAKTLDVVLHVVIHYAHYPDCPTAKVLAKWLNTAMDTKMMAFLADCYPNVLSPWPKTIEQVQTREQYGTIQDTVRQYIREEPNDCKILVDFDDIYWRALNK